MARQCHVSLATPPPSTSRFPRQSNANSAVQPHRCRSGHRGATVARCTPLEVAETPRRPTAPLRPLPRPSPDLARRAQAHRSQRRPRVITPAAAVKRRRTAATSRSAMSCEGPAHFPAPSPDHPRCAQAHDGERRHSRRHTGYRGATTARTPPAHDLHGPAKARPTSARRPCTLPDTRRPTVVNDTARIVAPAITVRRWRAAPTTRSPRPREAPRSLSPPPRTLPQPSSTRAGPQQRTTEQRSLRRPPRCRNGAKLPPGGLQPPAKARVTSQH
ncbi:hypothetical protein BKA93DRAFT_806285, partial [Sparassis latifolia]